MKPIQNPPNPFQSHDCEYLDGLTPPARLEIYEDATKTILSENKSPDIGFRWSLNPYRGCTHACAYCYARPSHEYLGFGAGTDFDSKIVVKPRAPELLRDAFMKKSWKGEQVVFSGDTDCYQPVEASYRLTRGCLEVCLEFGNPAGIITKSFLIVRDLDLLKKLHERTRLWIVVSTTFLDESTARLVEPGAASAAKRFEIVKILSDAGLNVAVNIAPIIPGLNDSDIPGILKKAKDCGARSASYILLRLPGNVKEVFSERILAAFPQAHDKIMGRIRQTRGGKLYNSQFGKRFSGEGEYWDTIEKIFEVTSRKLGLMTRIAPAPRLPFRRPGEARQLELI